MTHSLIHSFILHIVTGAGSVLGTAGHWGFRGEHSHVGPMPAELATQHPCSLAVSARRLTADRGFVGLSVDVLDMTVISACDSSKTEEDFMLPPSSSSFF